MANYQYKSPMTQLQKALKHSLSAKKKAGHSRNVSAGFICEDIEDIKLNPYTHEIMVRTPSFTQRGRAIDFNIREVGEMVKWTRHCKR